MLYRSLSMLYTDDCEVEHNQTTIEHNQTTIEHNQNAVEHNYRYGQGTPVTLILC